MFEIKKARKKEVKIYGEVFSISPLTVDQRDEFLEKHSEIEDYDPKRASDFAKEFVSARGIPLDFLKEMESADFDSLFAMLVGNDKEKK